LQTGVIETPYENGLNGDTVIVARGHYYEHLLLNGKLITLASNYLNSNDEDDILQTIIDGSGTGTILEISNVNSETIVMGFTFQNANDGIVPYTN